MPSSPLPVKKPFYRELYFVVLLAILAGAVLGHFFPETGESMKPLGDAFIKLIKMLIGPIIFCTVVTGIASMESMKDVGRVGVKALFYFEVATTIALVLGLVVANLLHPGTGMNIDPTTLDPKAVAVYAAGASQHATFLDFVMGLIPSTVMDAFAKGDLLQVLLFSVLFAWAVLAMGEKGKPIVKGIDSVLHAFFGVVGLIMKLAPIGAFGAMAFSIGKYGIGSLLNLLYLVLLFYATCALFVLVLGIVLRVYTGISLLRYLNYIKEEILIVLGTCSSETVLPRIIDKLTHLGCGRPVVGLVVPTGYSFNLDGSSIYFTLSALFLAQATNTPLGFVEQLTILGVLLISSKGAAAVFGSAFIILTGTLTTVGHIPVVSVVLLLGIDRFMAQGRAITNLIGNGIATIIVARWENQFDTEQAKAVLDGQRDPGLET